MYRYIFLFLILFCLVPGQSFGQHEEIMINRSSDKVILEGKVYYIHLVKEKETIYGLSKAYNVSEKVIATENPDVFAGLRTGMVLKIPADPVIDESVDIRATMDYNYHVVKEGETLYFLSKKYNVDLDVLVEHNPELAYSDLQINQVIKIPKELPKEKSNEFPGDDFIYHHVQHGETLYSLSKMYDVSVKQIKNINPDLRWGGLKFDEYIKIPRIEDRPVIAELDDTTAVLIDSSFIQPDSMGPRFWTSVIPEGVRADPMKRELRIAMLLPLELHWDELVDSLAIIEDSLRLAQMTPAQRARKAKEEEEASPVHPRMIGYLDFYQGALMAIDSMRQSGVSVKLCVYDTQRDRSRTREILQKDEMQMMDLIVGPVDFWNIEIVSEFSKSHGIPLISPFHSDQDLVNQNPYMIQLNPDFHIEFPKWAGYISDLYDKTLILVYDGDNMKKDKIELFKRDLFAEMEGKTDLNDVLFKEVVINDSVYVDLAHVLTQDMDNIVIVPSESEAYVSNVISPLYYLKDDYSIRIFGMPEWSKFGNIDLAYFHELQMNYYTSFYVDYQKTQVLKFLKDFRRIYWTEPFRTSPSGYNLAMYGYDIMFYFMTALKDYGRSMIWYLDQVEYKPMLGPYDFHPVDAWGGQINSYITTVQFEKDLSIHQLELKDYDELHWFRQFSLEKKE